MSYINETEGNRHWPGTISIARLASDARVNEVPERAVTSRTGLKGHAGLFVGRKDEIARLMQYFTGQRQLSSESDAPDQKRKRFAALVTNAPGAGKTTLVEEFADRMTGLGTACISFTPAQLALPERMIETIKKYVANTAAGKWNERLKTAIDVAGSKTVAVAGGAAVGALATAPAGVIVTGGIAALQGAMKRVARHWVDQPPQTVEAALTQLSAACKAGFIAIVDECTWLENKKYDAVQVQDHLYLIADTQSQTQREIHGGLLLAGLSSASDVTDDLKLSRALTIWLGPPTEQEAEVIIRKTLAQAKTTGDRRARLQREWPPALAKDFHNWMEHTAAAAEIARDVATATEPMAGEREATADEEAQQLEWVRTQAAREIRDLYAERMSSGEKAIGAMGPRRIVALADLTGNQIPMLAVERVIEHCYEETPSVREKPGGITQAKRELKEAGFISPADSHSDRDAGWVTARVPMPSLRRYVNEVTRPAAMVDARKIAREALQGLENDLDVNPDDIMARLNRSDGDSES